MENNLRNLVFLKAKKPAKELRKGGFCTFDVETIDGLKRLEKDTFCSSFAYPISGRYNKVKVDTRHFSNFDFMFNWIHERKKNHRRTVIYVHNLDFESAFIEDYSLKANTGFFVIKSGSKIIAIRIDEINAQFIDTVQILQSTQEQAEKDWNVDENLRKIDCKHIFEKDFKLWSEEEKEMVWEHNRNDVLALHEAMKKFRKTLWELDGVDCLTSLSLSSLSMNAFQHQMYNDENIPEHTITHKDGTKQTFRGIINPFLYFKWINDEKGKRMVYEIRVDEEKFVRKSYFGGRSETINLNRMYFVAYFDRNSMYAAEMFDKEYPLGVPEWVRDYDVLINLITGKDDRLGFIEVVCQPVKDENFPLLPLRMEQKVMFTNCERIWVYTIPELRKAYKVGYRISPIKGLIYPNKGKIFRNYIKKHYEFRKENPKDKFPGKNKMGKLFMNGLYGKFGQRMYTREYRFKSFKNKLKALEFFDFVYQQLEEEITPLEKEFGVEPVVRLIDKHANDEGLYMVKYLEKKESHKPFQNVALASYTTAYARINLWEKIKELESKKIRVQYCDTDSVVIPTKYRDKLEIGNDLGQWKIEEEFSVIQFLAPKAYFGRLSTKEYFIKAKGLDGKAIEKIRSTVNIFELEGISIKFPLPKNLKFEENPNVLSKIIGMDYIEQELRKEIKSSERYAKYSQSHNSGLIFDTVIPTKKFDFENLKRNFDLQTGLSIPWDDRTIPKKFKGKAEIAL